MASGSKIEIGTPRRPFWVDDHRALGKPQPAERFSMMLNVR
jgi:hypothetical protein